MNQHFPNTKRFGAFSFFPFPKMCVGEMVQEMVQEMMGKMLKVKEMLEVRSDVGGDD